jgi:hypothetical protein
MEDHGEGGAARRASGRVRKVAPKVGAALQDSNMRAQVSSYPFISTRIVSLLIFRVLGLGTKFCR